MVIAPHPDDAEIGMGGTIAQLIKNGHSLVVVDLCDGEPTPFGSPEIRAKETQQASQILGIQNRINLGLKNREIFDTAESRNLLAGKIREYKPKVLFAPYWDDAHPDHYQAFQLSVSARFYAKFVKSELPFQPYFPRKMLHYCSLHLRAKVQPSFIFDISSTAHVKMNSLRAYHSQFLANPNNKSALDSIEIESRFWGVQAGMQYGEPFICREQIRVNSTETLLNF